MKKSDIESLNKFVRFFDGKKYIEVQVSSLKQLLKEREELIELSKEFIAGLKDCADSKFFCYHEDMVLRLVEKTNISFIALLKQCEGD